MLSRKAFLFRDPTANVDWIGIGWTPLLKVVTSSFSINCPHNYFSPADWKPHRSNVEFLFIARQSDLRLTACPNSKGMRALEFGKILFWISANYAGARSDRVWSISTASCGITSSPRSSQTGNWSRRPHLFGISFDACALRTLPVDRHCRTANSLHHMQPP